MPVRTVIDDQRDICGILISIVRNTNANIHVHALVYLLLIRFRFKSNICDGQFWRIHVYRLDIRVVRFVEFIYVILGVRNHDYSMIATDSHIVKIPHVPCNLCIPCSVTSREFHAVVSYFTRVINPVNVETHICFATPIRKVCYVQRSVHCYVDARC